MTRKSYHVSAGDRDSKERKLNSVALHEVGQANGVQKAPTTNGTEQPKGSLSTSKVQNGSTEKQTTGNKNRGADDIAAVVIGSSHSGLPEDEAQVNKGCCGRNQKKVPTVGFLELFRYAGAVEIFMMVLGTLGAMATGCAQPVNLLLYGQIANVFIDAGHRNFSNSNQTYEEVIKENIQSFVLNCLTVGCVTLAMGYIGVSMWTWAGERQINNIRKQFFRGVMRQDIGWFDTHEMDELNSRFSDDMRKIRGGIGDTVPIFVHYICNLISSYVIAFVRGWKLTLVVFAFSPLTIGLAGSMSRLLRTMTVKELKAYAKAGAVAEQALRAIRTVHAFQGQEKEGKRYDGNLMYAKTVGIRKGLVLSLGTGLFWIIFYVAFAVTFYQGIILIQKEGMDPGSVMVVFLGVITGSMSLGHVFPNLESFSNARAAAVKVYDIINLRPVIDVSSMAGKTLTTLKGVIEFKDIYFRYPARPEAQVPDEAALRSSGTFCTFQILKGLNLTVNPGQTVAVVGASGCGKSTIMQLLQRFYDPESGEVTVDGYHIRDMNLKWLRDQIGVVSQEPLLFAATIAENIRYGQPEATREQVKAAAKEANAHDFITKLPQGYETLVGERGAQLSGGQKQRIALARALVKNPRILLLDEATSALDQESEVVVQNAMEKAQQGRTTIVIAHRLSTIRHADKIVAISHGRKHEEGSHDQLMAVDGLYAQLVKLQIRAEEEGNENIHDLEIIEEDDEESSTDPAATCPKILLRSISSISDKFISNCVGRAASRRKSSWMGLGNEMEEKRVKQEEKETPQVGVRRLLRLNAPEWVAVLLGTVMTTICGLAQPCFAFVFSEFLNVFSLLDKEEQSRKTTMLSLVIVGVGFAVFFLRLGTGYFFAKSGSELTARLRSLTFRAMLRQDMSFFDEKDNEVGSLTTRLSGDAALVQGATGNKIGAALEATANVAASLVIAFIYGWKLTLVILAFLPVMMVAGKVQGSVIAGSAKAEKSHLRKAGKICSEAVDNIRTVVSLNRGDIFIEKLEKLLDSTSRKIMQTAQLYGLTYGLSVSFQYFAMTAAFAFGAMLVVEGEMKFANIYRVFTAIVFSGISVGRNSSFGVDYNRARLAAGRLFAIIDRKPKIDIDQTGDKHLANYKGRVGLHKVVFRYPTRETVQVLGGLTVNVEPGQTLALVGGSGCGKSTVLQLLQRFYDPDSGEMLADGHHLKTLDLRWFRQQLGIVSQEPTLFDDSIAGNIAYGDNSRQVSMDEVIEAARAANIHNFIQELPQGYDTNVGDKGTQLSGGQKQRIAIARALVRRPKVLLLDEATSALDTESERVVQEALDKAREGRTCIVIAHRLTTIQNADRIAVLQDGRVEEIGTHNQLVAKEGAYFRLLHAQNSLRNSPRPFSAI